MPVGFVLVADAAGIHLEAGLPVAAVLLVGHAGKIGHPREVEAGCVHGQDLRDGELPRLLGELSALAHDEVFQRDLAAHADAEVVGEPLGDDDRVRAELGGEEAGGIGGGDHGVGRGLVAGAEFVDEISQRGRAGRRGFDNLRLEEDARGAELEAAGRELADLKARVLDLPMRDDICAEITAGAEKEICASGESEPLLQQRERQENAGGRDLAGLQAEPAECFVADQVRDIGADGDDLIFLSGERSILGEKAGLLDADDDGVADADAELRGGAGIEPEAVVRQVGGRVRGKLPIPGVHAEDLSLIDARGSVSAGDAAAKEQHGRGDGGEIVGERGT